MQWIARDDANWKAMELRDYISSLPSEYERDICRRYMAGEDIRTIATAENTSISHIRQDIKQAMTNYYSNTTR